MDTSNIGGPLMPKKKYLSDDFERHLVVFFQVPNNVSIRKTQYLEH